MREYNLIVQNNSNSSETLTIPVIIYDYDSSKSNYETYIALTTKKYKLRINHSRFNSTVSANISGNVLKESILISDYNPDEWNNSGSSGGTNYGGSGSSSGNGGSSSSGGGGSSSGGSGGSSSGGSSSGGGGTSTNHYIKIVGNAHSYISATTTSVNISVKANVKWKVTNDKPDWIDFDKTTGGTANTETTTSVTISFSAYEGSNGRREAYIRFIENNNESGVGATYNITQYDINEPSENASLSVYSGPADGATISNTGAEISASLTSNTRWVINEYGYALSDPYSGSGNSNLDITVYQNPLTYSITSGVYVNSLKNNKLLSDGLSWSMPKGGELSNYEIQHFSSNFALSFTGNPGYFSMCLQTHVPWEITSCPDWISLSPTSGGAGEYIIGGYFPGSSTALSGTIEIASTDPNYPVTTTKSISTNGVRSDMYIDVKSVYRDDINVSDGLTFNVYSNTNWKVVNYVRSSAGDEYGFFDNDSGRMSGSGNGTVTLHYSGGAGTYYVDLMNEDESVTYYELTIEVYDTEYGSSQYQPISPNSNEGTGPMPSVFRPSLYIKKNGGYYNYATVGIDGGNYDINGDKCEFMIISDSAWYIETPSWISVNKSSGNGDTVVEYTVDENDSGEVRSDVIFVATSDDYASDTVHVRQIFNSYELVLEIDQDESDHGNTTAMVGEVGTETLYGGGKIAVSVKLFKNVIQNGNKVSIPSSDWYIPNPSIYQSNANRIYIKYWDTMDGNSSSFTIKSHAIDLTSAVTEVNTMIETNILWHAHYRGGSDGVWAEYDYMGLESARDYLDMDEFYFHKFGSIYDMEALINNPNKPDGCDLYINKNYSSAAFDGVSGVMDCELYHMINVSGHSDIMPFGSSNSYIYIDYRGTHSLKIETSSGEDVTNLFSTKTLGYYDLGERDIDILVSDVSRVWGDLTLTQL